MRTSVTEWWMAPPTHTLVPSEVMANGRVSTGNSPSMLPSLANILVTLFPGANVTGETHPDTAPIKTDAARIGADWYNKFNRAVAGPKLCYCLVGVICYPYALAIEGQSPRAVHREGTQDSAIARAQLGQTGIVRPATLI